MISQLNFIRFALLALFVTGLNACNVEDPETSNTTVKVTSPIVTDTSPMSGATGVALDSDIVVTFDQDIAEVLDSSININTMNVALIIEQPVTFTSSFTASTLTIVPDMALQAMTMYQVSVAGVKSAKGTVMATACTWQFETTNAGEIVPNAMDNAVVCDTSSVQGSPNAPQNVKAMVVDSSTVALSWQAPQSGPTASYYKIEKSVGGNGTFVLVNNAITETSYTDTSALQGLAHVYRITAGNDVALSTVFSLSNEVIPGDKIINDKPQELLMSQMPSNGSFGWVSSISPDGMILAVGEPNGIAPGTAIRAGTVQLFNKTTSGWTWFKTISAATPLAGNLFGFTLSFSSDNNTLAITEVTNPAVVSINTNQVYLYSKSTDWTLSQTLDLAGKTIGATYGYSLAFSPDGSSLAVSDINGNTIEGHIIGVVHLYTKNLGLWQVTQHLISDTSGAFFEFGSSLAFSADSSILAIGEAKGDPEGKGNAVGSVQLFSNNAGWAWTETLLSDNPTDGNYFGVSVSFSPDSMNLAIGESFGDQANAVDAGTVHVFTNDGSAWVSAAVLSSDMPVTNNLFGAALGFSSDSSMLIVGESNGGTFSGGTVQVFKNINGWTWSNNLLPEFPAFGNQFGHSLSFGPDGTLAVGDHLGDPLGKADAGTTDSGTVNIYDLTQLP